MFASDHFEKDFLFQNPTLNVKCYSNMNEVSIYNQMFVCNGQIQKEKMNRMFILVLIFFQYLVQFILEF